MYIIFLFFFSHFCICEQWKETKKEEEEEEDRKEKSTS